jgi:hypothetical protein
MTIRDAAQVVASQKWFHTDAVTGESMSWEQEEESLCTSREQAIGIIQRTLDFWSVKMRDMHVAQGADIETARKATKEVFGNNLRDMMHQEFPIRWGLKISDFSFEKC